MMIAFLIKLLIVYYQKIQNKSKHMENTKFEQSFHLTSNDEKKWLKTPGEEGLYMIDIRITDVRDLRSTPPNDWWQKVNKKMIILAQSSKDPLYVCISNVMKLGLNRLKKVPNAKSGYKICTILIHILS